MPCIVHHMVHHLVNVMPQCMAQHSVRRTVQAAIAEFCPKSCEAAAIDFGCGVGKYLPLLAEHTVRCLPPALYACALHRRCTVLSVCTVSILHTLYTYTA